MRIEKLSSWTSDEKSGSFFIRNHLESLLYSAFFFKVYLRCCGMRTFGYQPCFVLSALFEARSLEPVNEAVAQLPMVQVGVLECEILPLALYTGLEELFAL